MIELKQVTFRYDNAPENAHSIRNINLTIQNGECVVLCGRSGCGKTTITRLINGLIPHYYEGICRVTFPSMEQKSKISSFLKFHSVLVLYFKIPAASSLMWIQHRSWRSDVKIRDCLRKMCWNELRMRRIIFS